MNRVKEIYDNYFIIYEDEEGRRVSKNRIHYHKGPLFKCWVSEGTRFQIERVK